MFAVNSRIFKFLGSVYIILCAITITGDSFVIQKGNQASSKWANNEEIKIFREYLRIPTVSTPKADYKPAVEFLKRQAASLNLPISIYYPVDKDAPVVVMTWQGSQPKLPSIMLNSHMDVVPVFEEFWTHPPFAAEIDENGDIFARGAQDTKCVGTQYLAAIRSMKRKGINQLSRTIHIAFVPDEEIGGDRGVVGFVKTDAFKKLNVAFVLDEGSVANEDGTVPAFITERRIWQIEITYNGQSGHGSKLFDNTPGEKLNYVVNKLMEYRSDQKRKMEKLNLPLGNVTSVNLTKLRGGVANNVIPAELSTTFDIRLSIDTDVDTFIEKMKHWFEEAGGNITVHTLRISKKQTPTRADDSNPFWVAFKNGAAEAGITVIPTIMGGGSDMENVRVLNLPAIGFAPLLNTTYRFHDHNEYVNADVYLKGIEIYEKIIPSIANI